MTGSRHCKRFSPLLRFWIIFFILVKCAAWLLASKYVKPRKIYDCRTTAPGRWHGRLFTPGIHQGIVHFKRPEITRKRTCAAAYHIHTVLKDSRNKMIARNTHGSFFLPFVR